MELYETKTVCGSVWNWDGISAFTVGDYSDAVAQQLLLPVSEHYGLPQFLWAQFVLLGYNQHN